MAQRTRTDRGRSKGTASRPRGSRRRTFTKRQRRVLTLCGAMFAAGALLGTAAGYVLAPGGESARQTATVSDPSSRDTTATDAKPAGSGTSKGASSSGNVSTTAAATQPDPATAKTSTSQEPKRATWVRNAADVPARAADRPKIAIVIDDLGLDAAATRRAIDLPTPITLSFLTYAPADQLHTLTRAARSAGHEVMAHVPMQPTSADVDPGPHALTTDMSTAALAENLDWGLSRLNGYVGINNHMGSAVTADRQAMRLLARELDERGLLFLDSRTTVKTVARKTAAAAGVPHTERDVFLDNKKSPQAIRTQLRELAATAREHGSAVAIGHPYDVTLNVLADWIPEARRRGLAFVPISAVVTQPGRDSVAQLPE